MVKFGLTGNMRKRLYALQTNAPWPLAVMCWAPCGSRGVSSALERLLLSRAAARLGATRVSGEWFGVPTSGFGNIPEFVQEMYDLVSDKNATAYRDRMMARHRWRRVGVEVAVGLRGRQWYIALAENYFGDEYQPMRSIPLPSCEAPA